MNEAALPLYIGLMSGTSLDGVDGVLAHFRGSEGRCLPHTVASTHIPFPPKLRAELMALQQRGDDEIHREAFAGNQLVRCYAECITQLLRMTDTHPGQVNAIGAHGQTIRHRPELGYTRQINNGALLAELQVSSEYCFTDAIDTADFDNRIK